jgi:pSer/pThr/pTyr-binding forkhead associated (FHA) protein
VKHPAAEPTPEFATVAIPLPTGPGPDFGTVVLSREEAAAAAAQTPDFGTIVAPAASLTREEPDGSAGPTYRLGLVATIGRTADNEIPVELPEVSRRHARLIFENNGFTIKDLNSNNGTYVNGERVPEARLKQGDRIQVGPAVFLFSEY